MKTRNCIALLLLGAMLCGCASSKRAAERVAKSGDETPPDFLSGPACLLLTNLDGYSARLTASVAAGSNETRTVSGDLLCREGRLIFQPGKREKSRHKEVGGAMTFLWDANRQRGFVMNEALQGYAPITSPLGVTSVQIGNKGVAENIDGKPCHRAEARIDLADGSVAKFAVWQADNAGHFPLRIQSVDTPNRLTLNFSDIQIENPAPELFLLPDGYTKYASAGALMSELLIRQTTANKKDEIKLSSDAFDNNSVPGNPAGRTGMPR